VIEVLSPGPRTTVQDLGRPGHAALGVGRSGAADRPALRLANRLVGNAEGAAAIEITLGGFSARFAVLTRIALAGAPCDAQAVVTGAPGAGACAQTVRRGVAMHAPVYVPAGAELRLGTPDAGLRTYLAVAGGIDVPPTLGSRATDMLAGLGPERLRPGTKLPIGVARGAPPGVDAAPVPPPSREPVLRVRLGPREDWFAPGAVDRLVGTAWQVTADADRVGIRLDGPPLERAGDRELPSEAMVEGALQVPPSGRPVLFLADHPVTGGYPVIGVVPSDDVPLAAQLRPGDRVRFRVEGRTAAG
jgi:biotin-dependent carboxylase-like uncharacterized protein